MYKINGLITVSLLGLTACGGGGGSSSDVANGVFRDSSVSGLTYESGRLTGVTNEQGAFRYEEGTDVSFNIGAVDLGSGAGQPVMTPLNLVEGGELATPEVINRARFLMMLDKDNMPGNGIELSREVQEIAGDWPSVDFTATDFPTAAVNRIITEASVADETVHELPDAETASAHLRTTLLCSNAGAYIGSYTGGEEGNIALVVNPITGEVSGSSFNAANEVSTEISNTTVLDFDAGLEFAGADDVGKTYSGIINSTESISGDWVSTLDATQDGSFDVNRLGGASDAMFRYTVSFTGSDKGLFTFDVDSRNRVTGTSYSVSTNEESPLEGSLEDNTLTVTASNGTRIDGVLDPETLSLSGVWSNVDNLQAGAYVGAGCLLN